MIVVAIISAIIGIWLFLLGKKEKDKYTIKMTAIFSKIKTEQAYDYIEDMYCTHYIGICEYNVDGKKYEFEVGSFSKEFFDTTKTYEILVNPNDPQESVAYVMTNLLNESIMILRIIIKTLGISMIIFHYIFYGNYIFKSN